MTKLFCERFFCISLSDFVCNNAASRWTIMCTTNFSAILCLSWSKADLNLQSILLTLLLRPFNLIVLNMVLMILWYFIFSDDILLCTYNKKERTKKSFVLLHFKGKAGTFARCYFYSMTNAFTAVASWRLILEAANWMLMTFNPTEIVHFLPGQGLLCRCSKHTTTSTFYWNLNIIYLYNLVNSSLPKEIAKPFSYAGYFI